MADLLRSSNIGSIYEPPLSMINKAKLDQLYLKYNRKKYVCPDPLQFLYEYPDVRDREIVGLIASALSYGRVAQILKSVKTVLDKVGRSPDAFIRQTPTSRLNRIFSGFRHRFTTHTELVSLMVNIRHAIAEHGSLNACFVAGMHDPGETIFPALQEFAVRLGAAGGRGVDHLVPSPEKGSPCKRLNLFLRWMIRQDAVDPGGWEGIPRSKLIIPLDTHMARIGSSLGLTKRKSADMNMALEITGFFRKLIPDDPVKYDFTLTRFGIRNDLDMKLLLYKLS